MPTCPNCTTSCTGKMGIFTTVNNDFYAKNVGINISKILRKNYSSKKELIQAELDTLSDEELEALYAIIKQCIQSTRRARPRSLMATLRGIQIDAPPDFAANLDLYVQGCRKAA